ncbi:MAG TPA: HAMP domain-containing sensor histidine kinase [Candidatus Dormibacteraeota bacterium]
MSVARVDLVRSGARRVALVATGIVAAAYLLIAVAVVLIVSHNLTSNIDTTLSSWLDSMEAQRTGGPGGFGGPSGGGPRVDAPVLWWMYHPDGNYADSSPTAKAYNLALPVPPTSINGPQNVTISGVDFRVKGGRVGDDWAVVGQSMTAVDQARGNLIQAVVLIGPVLLLVVFLGALVIGRRVAAPVEAARRRQMDFTANASHELRTPLAVIQAQSSLALSQPRNADWYQRAFEQVNRESQRMRHLVDELLWLARFEAMPASTKPEPVDLAIIAQNGVDRFTAVAESRKQQLRLRVSGESPVIAASAEWLDHLVGVLIDNASKYTPESGSIEVSVGGDGHIVRMAVEDSGPGIPEAERGRIFDRFQRATDQPGGAGLGLAIANAVVRATNGRWQVGVSPAGGASMAITWPRVLGKPATHRLGGTDAPPLASLDA